LDEDGEARGVSAVATGTGAGTAARPAVTLVAPGRATTLERLVVLGFALCAIAVLAVAWSLAPDARGFGTHEKLGLPPCGLMQVAHIPCPSCGMTTAFAHAVRLEVVEAAKAQPFGLLLAWLAALTGALGPIAALAGTRISGALSPLASRRVALALLGGLLASWLYKIIMVVWMVPT
jgi:hypothetical protein